MLKRSLSNLFQMIRWIVAAQLLWWSMKAAPRDLTFMEATIVAQKRVLDRVDLLLARAKA